MKLFRIIALAAMLLAATSCGLLQSASTTPATSQSSNTALNGSSAGAALLGLYTQYKTDGKLDLSNINNILNLATLASNVKGVGGLLDSTGFLGGLISGSRNLVNNNNSSNVISALGKLANLNLNSLSGVTSSAAASGVNTSAAGITSAVSTLSSLFNTLK